MFLIDKYFAIKHAKNLLKNELKLGVPEKITRKNHKFKKFDDKVYGRNFCSINYQVFDEHVFSFCFEYNKYKTYTFRIKAHRLNLTFSQNGMRMIQEQYSHFTFRFSPLLTEIYFPKIKVKNIKELKEKLAADIKYWNNSGLYNLLLQLYKV